MSNFSAAIFRIAINLLVALLLFAKPQRVIDFFLGKAMQPAREGNQENSIPQ